MASVAGQRRGLWRSRWAAVGAAVAVTLGGGGMVAVNAASSPASSVITIDPVRILDTRDPVNIGLPGPFVSAVSQKLQVTGAAVPAGATGVLLNVTVVGPTAAGFLSVRPGDATGAPSTSSLNFKTGDIVPNSVQVGLPTSGANAGKIDITYDAFGQGGPTTEVLIDVVGYTSNAKLDALQAEIDAADAVNATQQAQIGAKANAADIYTKAQTDAALAGKVDKGSPIVMTQSPAAFGTITGTGPTTTGVIGPALATTANGIVSIPFVGPNTTGGQEYRLSQVEYCVAIAAAGAFVNGVVITSDTLSSGVPATTVINDLTDRTVGGCYTIVVPQVTARSFAGLWQFAGSTTNNAIYLSGIRTTWVPAAATLEATDGEAPTESFPPELQSPIDELLAP